jgi:hypothetical protein
MFEVGICSPEKQASGNIKGGMWLCNEYVHETCSSPDIYMRILKYDAACGKLDLEIDLHMIFLLE